MQVFTKWTVNFFFLRINLHLGKNANLEIILNRSFPIIFQLNNLFFFIIKIFFKKFKFKFKFFSLLQINYLFFLDHFDALISKINFKT
jgi:hypothetical protein